MVNLQVAQKALNYGVLGIAVLIILALILSLFSDSDNFTTAVYVLGTTLASLTIIEKAVKYLIEQENIEIIWASPRELLNIFHANQSGCHVITVTPDIINKIDKIGYDLELYSLDTVRMFQNDALEAGYSL